MNDEPRLMGIDHGEKRIGLALSDPLGIIASPLEIVEAIPRRKATERLAALVNQHNVSKIVLGLPTDSEGEIGPQASVVLRWARKLAAAIEVPVVLWDESFSTLDAASRRGSKRGKRHLDDVAAAVMLQSYLEARRSADEPGQTLQSFDRDAT